MKVTLDSPAALPFQSSLSLPPLSARPLILTLLGVGFFTSSFDIFLVLNLGGATLRLCQISLLLLYFLAAAKIVQARTILWPRGGFAIVLWCVLQGIVVSRSEAPVPSFELFCLLLFTVFSVFAVLQLCGRATWLETLVRIYLYSFVFMAVIGLIQFVLPSLHVYPFVQQWIRYRVVPRISGLSYEPSYYATYLVIGWVMLIDLRRSGAAIVVGTRWLFLIWIVSIALLFSTSRTAWVVMIAEGIAHLTPAIGRILRRQFHRVLRGDLRGPLPSPRLIRRTALSLLLVASVLAVININVLFAGTGINNTAAHSVDQRLEGYDYTVRVFHEHPWFGSSLGGVAARITQFKGSPEPSVKDIKINFGFPVPVEVLAASGVVGFIPFVWFFFKITLGERHLLRERWSDERAKWLRAAIRALFFEWLALCADQNLIRMYLWFHIIMIVLLAYNLRYCVTDRPLENNLVIA